MEPASLSATALTVFDLCPARFKAEHITRAERVENTAASLGSAVHGALEDFVQAVYIDKSHEGSIIWLLALFKDRYMAIFNSADFETVEYQDGIQMLKDWYSRTKDYLETVEVLSVERKENFLTPKVKGIQIPFNYIYDRLDRISPTQIKVVDYKTNRLPVRNEDLKKRIQVRAYGLAAQIKFPEAEEIFVELDMLRHGGPVGVKIRREDNVAFWKFLKDRFRQILETPDDNPPEKLNPECRFCVRKQACGAIRSNILVGGMMSVGSAQEMIDERAALEYQRAAINSAIDEMDKILLAEAREKDILSWESEDNVLEISASSRRSVDSERVEMVIGPKLFTKYGSHSITLGVVDKLLKGDEITDAQKKQLKSLIGKSFSEPRVKISPRNPIDD